MLLTLPRRFVYLAYAAAFASASGLFLWLSIHRLEQGALVGGAVCCLLALGYLLLGLQLARPLLDELPTRVAISLAAPRARHRG